MSTNLALDDSLLNEALEIGHLRTKKDTVTLALKEFIAKRKQFKILELAGSIEYDENYDYKAMRSR
jgi:Arc/MetJ family transcription regulator